VIHILIHFVIPLIVALVFARKSWLKPFLIMSATMLVDMDHLLADPIYDALRCSIGFHPLHTLIPISIYLCLCLIPKTRWLGTGLMIHMLLDSIDCQFNQGVWFV
jgi:hypothetical protein